MDFNPGTEVWAYGSHMKGTARPALDLVGFLGEKDLMKRVPDLKEVFEESNPPFRVDFFE